MKDIFRGIEVRLCTGSELNLIPLSIVSQHEILQKVKLNVHGSGGNPIVLDCYDCKVTLIFKNRTYKNVGFFATPDTKIIILGMPFVEENRGVISWWPTGLNFQVGRNVINS